MPRPALLLGLLLGFTLGGATAARAAFSSSATAAQSISSLALTAPTGLAGTPSGHDVSLAWTPGSGGTATAISALSNGTSSTCPGAGYTALGSTAGASYTDAGRYLAQGTWECYQAVNTHGTWWSQSGNPVVAVQIGVVATSVALADGGTAGRLDPGDTVVVSFNQPMTTASGPPATDNVCASKAAGTVVLGSTGAGGTCTTTQAGLGTLTGLTVSRNGRFKATWTWNAAGTVLTVTIGARTAGNTPTISGAATFTPSTTATALVSASGGFHVCDSNAGGGNCLAAATGGF